MCWALPTVLERWRAIHQYRRTVGCGSLGGQTPYQDWRRHEDLYSAYLNDLDLKRAVLLKVVPTAPVAHSYRHIHFRLGRRGRRCPPIRQAFRRNRDCLVYLENRVDFLRKAVPEEQEEMLEKCSATVQFLRANVARVRHPFLERRFRDRQSVFRAVVPPCIRLQCVLGHR